MSALRSSPDGEGIHAISRSPATTSPGSTSSRITPSARTARGTSWLVPAALILLSLIPSLAGGMRLVELAGDPDVSAQNVRFVSSPAPVVAHIVSVTFYCVIGAFQFSRELRRRYPRRHRMAGRLLIPAGLISAVSGLWMTQAYALPASDGIVLYWMRWVIGVVMVVAILLAVRALRRRDFTQHGAWMIRAYALGLGAGTQVLTSIPLLTIQADSDPTGKAIAMGAGWAINAAVAEWVIRRNRIRRQAHAAGHGTDAQRTIITELPLQRS